MSKDTEYNFPFRNNFELKIIAVWFAIAIAVYLCPLFFNVPIKTYHYFSIGCLITGLILGRNGIEIYIKKSRLKGYPLEFIDPSSKETLKLLNITDKEIIKNVTKRR